MSLSFDEVCQAALSLPCSPRLLPDLEEVLASDNADVEDLARLILLDPVLTASTLRLANSAFFSGSVPVETVAEAVMRLGGGELYRLAALSLVARWGTVEAQGYRWEAGDFCRASLVKAVAAEILAQHSGGVDPAVAFTSGLVHDIGKLAIAFSCGERLPAVRRQVVSQQGSWLAAETAVLGFNHTDVSGRLLAEWQFSPLCVAVARDPSGVGLTDADERCMAAHLHAAQYIGSTLGLGQGEDSFLFELNATLLDEHHISGDLMQELLPDVVARVKHLLKDKVAIGEITV